LPRLGLGWRVRRVRVFLGELSPVVTEGLPKANADNSGSAFSIRLIWADPNPTCNCLPFTKLVLVDLGEKV